MVDIHQLNTGMKLKYCRHKKTIVAVRSTQPLGLEVFVTETVTLNQKCSRENSYKMI